MAPRSPSPPPSRRRSPGPSNSRGGERRSRSPASRSYRDGDRYSSSNRRDSSNRDYDQDRYERRGDRRGDRDEKYDRRDNRRRSRSPGGRSGGGSRDDRKNGKGRERDAEGGDGGWGKRATSPGRPSQALPSQQALVRKDGDVAEAPAKPIEPNFQQSGALAAETNTLRGVVLKYNEPPEARKPVRNWRLYVFKGKEQVELFHVHRQSAYLVGRDRIVADIPIDHPSSSKQHAVLQFRQVTERNEFGDTKSLTKPFIIDLDSANGTMVNDEAVPPSRFYELKSGDVLKFAFSTREYVLLVEN
ncbi:hypothetical protein JCM3765_005297 [Sporobolomyces pararoseus]